MYVLSRPSKRL